jgi:hypothetical protein
MPTYVISLKYSSGSDTDFVEYETENPNLAGAKRDAKALAQEEREKTGLSVRIVRVESRAASDRRREREGF